VYVAWARRNRSALVRVPMYKPARKPPPAMELRCPDPAANPYLAFAVMLASAQGMERGYKLPEPVEADIFHMTRRPRRSTRSPPCPAACSRPPRS
jgi:glutamine synthetase